MLLNLYLIGCCIFGYMIIDFTIDSPPQNEAEWVATILAGILFTVMWPGVIGLMAVSAIYYYWILFSKRRKSNEQT